MHTCSAYCRSGAGHAAARAPLSYFDVQPPPTPNKVSLTPSPLYKSTIPAAFHCVQLFDHLQGSLSVTTTCPTLSIISKITPPGRSNKWVPPSLTTPNSNKAQATIINRCPSKYPSRCPRECLSWWTTTRFKITKTINNNNNKTDSCCGPWRCLRFTLAIPPSLHNN